MLLLKQLRASGLISSKHNKIGPSQPEMELIKYFRGHYTENRPTDLRRYT